VETNTLLMVFVGVASVAIVLQALALIGIYRAVRILSNRLDEMASGIVRDLNALATKADDVLATVKSVGEGINSLRQNLEKTLAIVHTRIESIDNFLGETTDIARLEILRLQDAIDTSARKVEEVFDVLRSSILAPAMEVNAIVRGIRTGIDFLFRRQKGISRGVHQDEEMFI
jgi:hypothetical protein